MFSLIFLYFLVFVLILIFFFSKLSGNIPSLQSSIKVHVLSKFFEIIILQRICITNVFEFRRDANTILWSWFQTAVAPRLFARTGVNGDAAFNIFTTNNCMTTPFKRALFSSTFYEIFLESFRPIVLPDLLFTGFTFMPV